MDRANELAGEPLISRWIVMPMNCEDAPTYFLSDDELKTFPERFDDEKFVNGWTEVDRGAADVIKNTVEVAKENKRVPRPLVYGKINTRANRLLPTVVKRGSILRKPSGCAGRVMAIVDNAAVLDAAAKAHNREMHAANGNIETEVKIVMPQNKPPQKPKQNKPKKKQGKKEAKPKNKTLKHVAALRSATNVTKMLPPIKRIVENLTLPMEYPAVRIKVDYENIETAIASPNAQFDADFIEGETVGFFFRDPIRASLTMVNTGATIEAYNAQFPDLAPAADSSVLTTSLKRYSPHGAESFYINPVNLIAQPVNTINPHGQYLYCGVSKTDPGYRWFPMTFTTGGTAEVAVGTFPTGWGDVDGIFSLRRYNGTADPDEVDTQTVSLVANGSITFNCNEDSKAKGLHYYALLGQLPQTDALGFDCNINVTIRQQGGIFAQKTIPGWEDNKTVASTIAINGYSALLSNAASQMSKNGKVVAVQVPANQQVSKIFEEGQTYDKLGKYASRYQGDASFGVYGFYRPSGVSSFFFNEYQPNLNETYRLESKHDFLAVCAECVAGTDATGQNLFWTNAYSCEFRTADTWRPQRQAQSTPRDLESALEAMSKIPQWHENPLHFKQIVGKINGFIGKALGYAQKYGPMAQSILGMLA